MYRTRTHVKISGVLFLVLLITGWGGNALEAAGVIKHPQAMRVPMMIFFFGLFLAFAFSLVPTMVKLFVEGQGAIGNSSQGFVRFIATHESGVIWTVWGIWILGLSIALPAMIQGGFFSASDSSPGAAATTESDAEIAKEIAETPTQGVLVAAPGMSVAEMIRDSTLKIAHSPNAAVPTQTNYAGGAIFDFRIAGTVVVFPRCRYYFITTYTHDPSRIESINIGTAQAKMTKAALDSADTALRTRLAHDGWLTGHEVYRTEEDQVLHGGKTRGDEGALWLKDNTALDIERRRLDDPVAGEDPATAGDWIQFVELWERKNYPSIDRFEFAPPQR